MPEPKFAKGDHARVAFTDVGVLDVRHSKNGGFEYLVGPVNPTVVSWKPDGTPRLSYGYPRWVPGYLVREAS